MKFTTGEFAKFHGISKQTLIYYDNIGLFKPNIIDTNNKYRYYTSDQFEILDGILILREIGVPINDIKSFLSDRDKHKTLSLLKEQKSKLDNQVKNIQKTIKRLDHKIDLIENLDIQEGEVRFLEMDLEYLAVEKVKEPFDLLQTDISFKNLITNAINKKYPYNYQLGTIISKHSLFSKDYTKADFVFLPLYKKFKDKHIIKKPKGLYAITLHKGEYTKTGKTYEFLIDNIYKNNFDIIGSSYEYCIFDSLTSYTCEDYITKLAIPVARR